MRTQTPEIIIEGYEEDPALQRITPDGILEAFNNTVDSVKNYLYIKPPSGFVRTIRFRPTPETIPNEKSYPDDIKETLGDWDPDIKQVGVYTKHLIYDKSTLDHEIGHAALDAILAEANLRSPGLINCTAETSAHEAFAEWVTVIASTASLPKRVRLAMQQNRKDLKANLPDEPELLLYTALSEPYPDQLVGLKDASIFNYIYCQGYTLNDLLAIVSFKPANYRPGDPGNRCYWRWTEKSYSQFKDVVETTLGVSVYKLAADAANWYDNSRQEDTIEDCGFQRTRTSDLLSVNEAL